MRTNTALSFESIHSSLQTLFGADLHAKRVLSLAGATLGVIQSASLAVAMIGQGLALARGRTTKHATKQVGRLLSNQGIDIDSLLHHWVPFVVGLPPGERGADQLASGGPVPLVRPPSGDDGLQQRRLAGAGDAGEHGDGAAFAVGVNGGALFGREAEPRGVDGAPQRRDRQRARAVAGVLLRELR